MMKGLILVLSAVGLLAELHYFGMPTGLSKTQGLYAVLALSGVAAFGARRVLLLAFHDWHKKKEAVQW